jgi:hypothetical protein
VRGFTRCRCLFLDHLSHQYVASLDRCLPFLDHQFVALLRHQYAASLDRQYAVLPAVIALLFWFGTSTTVRGLARSTWSSIDRPFPYCFTVFDWIS